MRWKWLAYFLFSNVVAVCTGTALLGIVGLIASELPQAMDFLARLDYLPNGSGFALIIVATALSGLVASIVTVPFIGMSFTTRVWGHLKSIAWGAESLARGDLSFRLPPSGDHELQSISDSFNLMASRLEAQVSTLQEMAEENVRLSSQASEKAVLEERRRLASDLHDSVSQLIFSINMSISAAIKLMAKKPELAVEQMEYVKDMSLRAQAEMRALLMHLRPVALDEKGFKQAAIDLLEEVEQKSGIDFDISIDDVEMSKSVEDNLFRILQEAVANSLKHASAKRIRVHLVKSVSRLLLQVEDDGVGMCSEPQKQTSYGLRTMEERAVQVGGSIDWLSLPGRGTRVEVRVPLGHHHEPIHN